MSIKIREPPDGQNRKRFKYPRSCSSSMKRSMLNQQTIHPETRLLSTPRPTTSSAKCSSTGPFKLPRVSRVLESFRSGCLVSRSDLTEYKSRSTATREAGARAVAPTLADRLSSRDSFLNRQRAAQITCRALARRTTIGPSQEEHRDPRFLNITQRQPTPRQRIHRQDAYLRRLFQRPEDLPRQGALI